MVCKFFEKCMVIIWNCTLVFFFILFIMNQAPFCLHLVFPLQIYFSNHRYVYRYNKYFLAVILLEDDFPYVMFMLMTLSYRFVQYFTHSTCIFHIHLSVKYVRTSKSLLWLKAASHNFFLIYFSLKFIILCPKA